MATDYDHGESYHDYVKSELKSWLVSVIFGIICYLPWLRVLLSQMKGVHGNYWIKGITLQKFLEFFGSIFINTSEFNVNLILTLIFVIMLITVLIQYKNSKKDNGYVLLGFLVFVGTVLFGVFVSFVFSPILVVRYLIPVTAIVWLSFSIFISNYDFKKVIIPVVIVLLLFSAFNVSDQIDNISKNHEKLIKNQEFLESINNNDSVVIIMGMVKYVHFYDQLNESIVYGGFSVDEREDTKDYIKVFDDEKSKFLIPDDFEKYGNKTIYIAYRESSNPKLPNYVVEEEIGMVENCKFFKLNIKN